jgi:hypothetical protein
VRVLALLAAVAACKSKRDAEHEALPVVEAHHAAPSDAAPKVWPELAALPVIGATRTVILPAKPDQPRFDVVGPAILGDIAVVGSSQLGFAGVDWRRGQVMWTKPTGSRLAPPAIKDDDIYLIGDCTGAPDVKDELIGCLRSVTVTGADQAYIAIHGAAVNAFSHATGPQHVWIEGGHARWVRGDQAVTIDLMNGVAVPASIEPPPLSITLGDRHWDVEQAESGAIIARAKTKQDSWQTDRAPGDLVGVVWLPRMSPLLRFVSINGPLGEVGLRLHDLNATGSMNTQVSLDSVPGIAMLAHAASPVGDVALAVRLDKSLKHDYIAGFSANALLQWVYPLPETTRVDPIGIAIGLDAERAPEAVVVFHDGDTVTVLPELSSPPTAPGAVRGPSENATP